jgi:hypothetical protein
MFSSHRNKMDTKISQALSLLRESNATGFVLQIPIMTSNQYRNFQNKRNVQSEI